jgi:hypothetical protein
MKLVGFSYKKLSCERTGNSLKDLKIESKIDLEKIEKVENNTLNTKDMILRIIFDYSLDYNPNLAKINVSGEMIISIDEKTGNELVKDWKSKDIDEKTRLNIFNIILKKTNVKTLEMEELIGVPHHFQMPTLKPSN